jgi:hypothetical protein
MATEMKATKVSARVVDLSYKCDASGGMWDGATCRMRIQVPSGNVYYSSVWNYQRNVKVTKRFSFSSSVTGWVQWWVEVHREYMFAEPKGPDFYVPM